MNLPQPNDVLFNLRGWAPYALSITEAIHEADDIAAIGRAALQAATQAVSTRRAGLVVLNPPPYSPLTAYTWSASGGLQSVAGLPDEQRAPHVLAQTIHNLALTSRPAVLAPQDEVVSLIAPHVGFTPAAVLPLVCRGEPVGLIVVDSPGVHIY